MEGSLEADSRTRREGQEDPFPGKDSRVPVTHPRQAKSRRGVVHGLVAKGRGIRDEPSRQGSIRCRFGRGNQDIPKVQEVRIQTAAPHRGHRLKSRVPILPAEHRARRPRRRGPKGRPERNVAHGGVT